MAYDTYKIIDILISNISEMSEVQSIGICGSKSSFPRAGEGILIFLYIVI